MPCLHVVGYKYLIHLASLDTLDLYIVITQHSQVVCDTNIWQAQSMLYYTKVSSSSSSQNYTHMRMSTQKQT